jgi:hypothetical protein
MLLKLQIEMLQAAAEQGPEILYGILLAALKAEDYDTCDYIADHMFEKLSAEHQAALIRSGVVKTN